MMKSSCYTLLFLAALTFFTGTLSRDDVRSNYYKRSDSESSYQDSVSEHDSLTPIEDTDSAPSDHGRKYAPGSPRFHRKMYKFQDQKMKYNKTFGDAYKTRGINNKAEEHYAESKSSRMKKIKHKKLYKGIMEKNLKPGEKTAKQDAIKKKDFPTIPNETEASDLTRDTKFVFNRRKGHHYLVGKKEPAEKPKALTTEQVKSTSPSSLPAQTLTKKKHESEKGMIAKQVKSPTPSTQSSPGSKHNDEGAKTYYGSKPTSPSVRRMPVQRLGGGGKDSARSDQTSDGYSSTSSTDTEWEVEKVNSKARSDSEGHSSGGSSGGIARGRSISRSRSPVSSSSHSRSDGSLTPIDLTDDATSDHNRKVAPGTRAYHSDMYGFYDAKKKYHKVMGNAYYQTIGRTNRERQNFDAQAQKHYDESVSSQKKKMKHKKYGNGVMQGNLEPGYKSNDQSIKSKDYPKVPSKSEARRMIKDPKITFNKHKGHFHLVAQSDPEQRDHRSDGRRSQASSSPKRSTNRTPVESEHSSVGNRSGSRSNYSSDGNSSENHSREIPPPKVGTRRHRRS